MFSKVSIYTEKKNHRSLNGTKRNKPVEVVLEVVVESVVDEDEDVPVGKISLMMNLMFKINITIKKLCLQQENVTDHGQRKFC